MSDLIVVDEFYEEMGKFFKKEGKHLDKIAKEYTVVLKVLKARGICEGETAQALTEYINLASQIDECAAQIGESVKSMLNSYIKSIDVKDKYIF